MERKIFTGEIYLITNSINNKIYVGQTKIGYLKRFKGHISSSKKGVQTHLYRAFEKYGVDNFSIKPIHFLSSTDFKILDRKLDFWEKYYIKFFDSRNNGYNLLLGGKGASGCKWSEASKRKRTELLKKIFENDEYKKKATKGIISLNKSEEGRAKMSKFQKERFKKKEERLRTSIVTKIAMSNLSPEKLEKVKAHQFKLGATPYNKGKSLSEEQKKKISESCKGRKAWNKGLKTLK